ncbi:MAG: hypothetical protein AB8I08_18045 [Sandaracinaceae bacterium]
MRRTPKVLLVLVLGLAGCAQGGGDGTDAGRGGLVDAAPPDSGMGTLDAGEFPRDAGPPPVDAGSVDAGAVDAGALDGGPGDAGMGDAGMGDAGPACTMDTQCDDSDACTIDMCADMMCTYAPVPTTGSDCGSAIDISAGGTFMGESSCAANDSAGACSAGDAPDVHFTFTLTETSDVTLDTVGSAFDAVIGLGSTCLGGELGCDDDSAGSGQGQLVRADLAPGTYFVTLDGKAGGAGGEWVLNASIVTGPTTEVVAFPSGGDVSTDPAGLFLFSGEYVEGVRTTSLPDITGADIVLNVPFDDLFCSVTMGLAINGTAVGTFTISAGDRTVTSSFSFPAITGPTYTLRYERITSSICDLVQVGPGDTVTLSR